MSEPSTSTPGLLEAFRSSLPKQVEPVSGWTTVRDELVDWVRRGRREHPEFALAPDLFIAHAGAKIAARPALDAFVLPTSLHVEELYLAFACALGQTRALEKFRDTYGADIDKGLRRAPSNRNHDDLRQRLEVKLFVASNDQEPMIASYCGAGSLQGWVRVVVSRMVVDVMRATRNELHGSEPLFADALAAEGLEPDLLLLRAQQTPQVQAALEFAFSELTPRERRLLRGLFVHKLSTHALGEQFGVHRTTAARWAETARERLVTQMREYLQRTLGDRDETVQSLVALVQSQLHVSIARHLASQNSTDT